MSLKKDKRIEAKLKKAKAFLEIARLNDLDKPDSKQGKLAMEVSQSDNPSCCLCFYCSTSYQHTHLVLPK